MDVMKGQFQPHQEVLKMKIKIISLTMLSLKGSIDQVLWSHIFDIVYGVLVAQLISISSISFKTEMLEL